MSDVKVRIQLGETDSRIIERYEVKQSFFAQPGAFAARVGWGGITADLLRVYPPGTPFVVWFDLPDGRSIPQMTGLLEVSAPEGSAGATEVNLHGRDWMRPLFKSMPRVERAFSKATYRELVEAVLREAGVPDFALVFTNDANRAAIQGVPKFETVQVAAPIINTTIVNRLLQTQATVLGPVGFAADYLTRDRGTVDVQKLVGYTVPNPLKAKPGQTWLTFLQAELSRAGLFIFAGTDEKTFIVTRPNADQRPTFRIHRKKGDSRGIISARHNNNAEGRHSHYVVYGRGGGGTDGRNQVKGEYVDQEMVNWGLISVWSHEDALSKTSKQAEYLARRQAAGDRRNGWDLTYTLEGHDWPIIGQEDKTAVLGIDADFDVIDEEYGIQGLFWSSSATYRDEGQGKRTEIVLARPGDLLFGDDVVALSPRTAKKKVFGR